MPDKKKITKKKIKKTGLGRGLDALLSSRTPLSVNTIADETSELQSLPIGRLQTGQYQPRSTMNQEKLQELADSIQAQGIVQPIVVRKISSKKFEIIAGERRWRAAQLAKLSEVPVLVKDVNDQQTIAMALIENIQREDLNPLEEASALKRLIDEFDLTHLQAAEAVGRSRVAVSNILRLIELHSQVKDLLNNGLLEMGHARCLLPLEKPDQPMMAQIIVAKKMSVRQAEALVKAHKNPPQKKPAKNKDKDIQKLEQQLTEKLCSKVEILHASNGKGKMVIHYYDSDELEGILERFKL
ncbi:MAG: ParB/RepB/Spo0J family partition protein [Proteobacteria bacterium]|nr:ParB/RepB/Spo0J family partition protein [Pseudomonadota bacterium]